jgi:hypothetical protein
VRYSVSDIETRHTHGGILHDHDYATGYRDAKAGQPAARTGNSSS